MAEAASTGNSSSSKSLMWMMIALFIGLALLLAGGLFIASRVVRSLGLTAASAKDTIRTPAGSFRLEKETQVGPGLPVYPRSSLVVPDDTDAAAAVKQAQSGVELSTYHTTDMRDYVDNWYKEHLSPEFTRHDPGDNAVPASVSSANVSDGDVTFVAERDQMVRVVALSIDSGGTKISLVRFNKAVAGSDGSPMPDQSAPTAPAPTTPDTSQPQ
ncbi:MAG: hypothetical protein ACRD51_04850 [Candidatus Acidiferrum sp.]